MYYISNPRQFITHLSYCSGTYTGNLQVDLGIKGIAHNKITWVLYMSYLYRYYAGNLQVQQKVVYCLPANSAGESAANCRANFLHKG